MIKVLKTLSMDHGPATYCRALRAAALAVYDRPEDRTALRADAAWLLRAAVDGSYTYTIPPFHTPKSYSFWDNSNSQYGALGVWSASQASYQAPIAYWKDVEKHWIDCQLPDGQWGYQPDSIDGQLSMTVAGVTTLFVGAGSTHRQSRRITWANHPTFQRWQKV